MCRDTSVLSSSHPLELSSPLFLFLFLPTKNSIILNLIKKVIILEPINILALSLQQLSFNLLALLPRLVMALIIWYVGKYFIALGVKLVRKLDIKTTKVDDKAIDTFARLVDVVGKVLLVMIVLDYLGIGSTVVGAITSGMVYAIAIALGLAFGKALEDDAKDVVGTVKSFMLTHKK